jgi:Zn-dependent protease
MILSLSVHEFAHASTAYYLGDDTASREGRFTLNPISHIDIWGTIIIPLIGLTTGAPFFGWAKPVPVNPARFSRKMTMRNGMAFTAFAGPFSNFVLAIIGATLFKIMLLVGDFIEPIAIFLNIFIFMNIGLGFFNLLPVPPLDGSKVLMGILPDKYTGWITKMEQNPLISFGIFMVIIYFAGGHFSYPIIFIGCVICDFFGIPSMYCP